MTAAAPAWVITGTAGGMAVARYPKVLKYNLEQKEGGMAAVYSRTIKIWDRGGMLHRLTL